MTDEDLKALFDGLRQENAAAHAETRRQFDVTAEGLRQESASAQVETRRHFDVTSEALRHEIRLVAEAVAQVDEKVGREAERVDRGFSDTQAMIKFSHAELDRRVHSLEQSQRSLEETVSDLQSRVERLESSTH